VLQGQSERARRRATGRRDARDRRRRQWPRSRRGAARPRARCARGRVDAGAGHRARGRARDGRALRRHARRRALEPGRRVRARDARPGRFLAVTDVRQGRGMSEPKSALEARIANVARDDRADLRALLGAIERRERSGRPASRLVEKLDARLEEAEARAEKRRVTRVRLEYPDELPISQAREQILDALARHRVIVVCGDTGSGKTTQLPKLCLEAGRGIDAMIGHTQPRRIAARSVAERLAEELGVELGGAVGYQVRFTDETNPATLVKVMTDGILLNEIRRDRWLDAYDTLIIDEAHERSLNHDFLLGFLRRLGARRPDLKIIVTSATIDPERFAEHFGGAPIIRVEGRTYPVEVRYRPLEHGVDLPQAVAAAVSELADVDLESIGGGSARDVLVFLPGERWIRDAER